MDAWKKGNTTGVAGLLCLFWQCGDLGDLGDESWERGEFAYFPPRESSCTRTTMNSGHMVGRKGEFGSFENAFGCYVVFID